MDRQRFEHLLEAYGADFGRWPADERDAAAAFAAAHADARTAVAEARALDDMLAPAAEDRPDTELLARRILAKAPRGGAGVRAGWALAACMVLGIVLGYGGGLLAPLADDDGEYFALAFEAPLVAPGDEG